VLYSADSTASQQPASLQLKTLVAMTLHSHGWCYIHLNS